MLRLCVGKFSLTRSKTVTGWHAYAIGVLLTLTLPVILGIGVVVGIVMAARNHGRPITPETLGPFAFLDLVLVPIILAIVTVLAVSAPKNGGRTSHVFGQPGGGQLPPDIPPADDNPYASPYTIDPNSPRPPKSS